MLLTSRTKNYKIKIDKDVDSMVRYFVENKITKITTWGGGFK